uniref:MAK10-like protein n=1 Tax=Tanacetum cinerariifolium TaxID=118510 RepID=A0A699GR36_TANCI|nr:hypothetical protein [Tanacetum cinerariifolium]
MAGVDINTLTMKQYLALSRENHTLSVVKPKIRGNINFEIKSQFMRELREDTFSGNKNEDAHDHFDRVLNILLDSHGPIPGMNPTQALMAIQTMADHSQKWHDGTSSRNISSNSNTDELEAIVSKLDNLGRDMKKLKENVHVIQVGCQICEGPRLDKECPLNEEVKQLEEVKYGESGRSTPFNESASINVMPRNTFKYLRLANLRNTNMLVEMADMTKKAPLGVDNTRVSYDMEKKDHNLTSPTEEIFMIKSDLENRPQSPACSDNQSRNLPDRSPNDSLHNQGNKNKKIKLDQHTPREHFCKLIKQTIDEKTMMWPTCDPTKSMCDGGDEIYRVSRVGNVGHTYVSEPVKKALLKLWLIDCFQDESGIVKNPLSRSFYDYKWIFDSEIDPLADEYELEIGKKDICLIRYGNTVKMSIKIVHISGMTIDLRMRNVMKWE